MVLSTNNQNGLSILGTLLATFLLASTVAAVSQLVARTQRVSLTSREVFTATTVAREGIELIRAYRDTNWFLKVSDNRAWTQGLCDGSEFTLDPGTVRHLNPVGDKDKSALYITPSGDWTHEATTKTTPYKRVLKIDCSDKDKSVLITSTVTWRGGDRQNHEWQVSERLYDWYR